MRTRPCVFHKLAAKFLFKRKKKLIFPLCHFRKRSAAGILLQKAYRCGFSLRAATTAQAGMKTRAGIVLLYMLACIVLMFPVLAFPAEQSFQAGHRPSELETIVVIIRVNTETKGEFFVNRTADGDFFVKTADLKTMGLRDLAGKTAEIEGEQYLSLKSTEGIDFVFNENTLSLEITAMPSLLPKRELDFLPQRRTNVVYTRDSAAFLNYRLDYFAGDSFSFQSFDLINQLGIRTGDLLFLTDSSYTKTPIGEQFVRLFTNITYDMRPSLQRLVVGDFAAASGDLGSSVTMGGLSLSKVYSMDPYLIKYPLANFAGFTSVPSTAEVYLNGMRIRTEKLPPGEFGLNNIYYYGGANSVEVVIKDAFGRIQTVRYPFYATDILLKRGLHEYSYNIGFIREELGTKSNDYSSLAFSGFHRYGVSDSLTIGISSEGGRGNYNLGAQASFLMKQAGVMSLALSGSRDSGGKSGVAGTMNYSYQGKAINTQLFFKSFTQDYATIDRGLLADKTKYEAGAAIGYSTQGFGSASVVFDKIKKYVGQDSQSLIVNYTRNLTGKISLFTSFTRRNEAVSSNTFFVGLTYYPREGMTLSSSYEKGNGTDSETLQIQKSLPVGEGFGYRASVSRAATQSGEITTANPSFQYNARYGTYTAEYSRQFVNTGANESYSLSAAGGIAYIGNTIGFSRPIDDSFGLVKVGSLEGVRVYQSNQEIGRTDSSGRVFVPNLGSYYDNQVSIADKDIPIDYSIKEVIKYISPPLRSGSIINFEVAKFQAITGTLKIKIDKEVLPVEFYEVSMMVDGKEITFPTGKGGEFYFENVKPGKYSASFEYKEKKCLFDIIIPRMDEMLVDLGGIICEDVR